MGTIERIGRPEPGTRVDQIVAALTERIERGLLRAGERLPSIRAASATFRSSKNTLVEAYDRLVAQGRIEARRGSGFYVCGRRPLAPERVQPGLEDAVDSVWLLREQLERHYEVRVGDGRPPASWMEGSELGRHLRPINRAGHGALPESYGTPLGFPLLRELIATTLGERSIGAHPAQVLMTHGANHALDLIIRHLVQPGDPVLVDSPGYYPLFGKLKLAKAKIIGVRRGPEGPDLDELTLQAGTSGAKLFFTQSLAHNPTGCSLTLSGAYRVLQLANLHGFRIVESDPFADVLPSTSPRIAALDQLERVIYVGTFAKTLSASLRTGYVAASQSVLDALTDLKMLTTVNSSGFVERVLYDLMVSGHYRRHLKRLTTRIEAATLKSHQTLHRLGLPVFGTPAGGFYMWCLLPSDIDDVELSRRAAKRGILLAPGSIFGAAGREDGPAMRVNVAYMDNPRFERFMAEARM